MQKLATIRTTIALAMTLGVIAFPRVAMACPTCKDGLHSDTALAYAISILFMMGMPFAIFTFWCVMIVRLRKLAATQASEKAMRSGPDTSPAMANQTVHSAQKINENDKSMVLS